MSQTFTAFFDGACWPNPGGIMGIGGLILLPDGQPIITIASIAEPVPGQPGTCNIAEWSALLAVLKAVEDCQTFPIRIYGDSQLVIKGMNRKWRVKAPWLKPIAAECFNIKSRLNNVSFQWIPREKNKRADELSRLALSGNRCAPKRAEAKRQVIDQIEQWSQAPLFAPATESCPDSAMSIAQVEDFFN